MSRAALEVHAAACRVAIREGRERPRWWGGCLIGTSLSDADLTGADLTGADLTGADLTDAGLTGAGLTSADLTGANLTGADLTGADLTGADLTGAGLTGANLTGADLSGADLTGAGLTGANLTGADLSGADLDEGTATGRAIGGHAGGYRWWAVALEAGDVVLQYGCRRHLLSWWLAQGPELSMSHGHPPEHWAEGPMVALAAAETLGQALPPGVRR